MNKLKAFVRQFTSQQILEVEQAQKLGRQYSYISPEASKLKNELERTPAASLYCAGILLGEEKDSGFKPGFELLDMIAKHTTRNVVLDDKGETLFLYSRNIFKDFTPGIDCTNGPVLVLNKHKEVLGYGILKAGRIDGLMLVNKLDKSDFLKRERKVVKKA